MALKNSSVDHTAPKTVGGDSVTVKIPKSVVFVVVAILVLTAVYVLGATIKERVTDPAIDKTVETVNGVAEDIAAMPEEQRENAATAFLEDNIRAVMELSGQESPTAIKFTRVDPSTVLMTMREESDPYVSSMEKAIALSDEGKLEIMSFQVVIVDPKNNEFYTYATAKRTPGGSWENLAD